MEIKDPKELIEKAILYLRLVQLDLGIPILNEAFKLAQQQNDSISALNALSYLMRCYSEREDFDSLFQLKSNLQELAFLEKISLNSQFYYTLGICSFYQNKYSEARQYFNLAYEKAEETSLDRKFQAEIGLSIIEIEEGKWEQARARIQMAYTIQKNTNNPQSLMSLLLIEGRLNRLTGHYAKALSDFSKALEINKYHKNLIGYFYLLYEKAMTYFQLGKTDLSKTYVDLLLISLPDKDVTRLKKLVHDLENKLNKSFEFDLIIDRRHCKIIEKNKGEINFGGQDLIMDLFIMFTQNPGKIYSKETLAQIIWNENYNSSIHDNKIYVTIKRLRTLIEPNIENPQYILRSRNGYYLNQSTKVDLL